MSAPAERVHFDLFAPAGLLLERGCTHRLRTWDDGPEPGCRTCVIEDHWWAMIGAGNITDWQMHRGLHPEFGIDGIRYSGWYTNDAGRLATQRVIAWLYGHPDPLELYERAGRAAP